MAVDDFYCGYTNMPFDIETAGKLGFTFPQIYENPEIMALLSFESAKANGTIFCSLPFGSTVEAEAFGADVFHGDGMSGPRIGKYVYDEVDKLTGLPVIDFSSGPVAAVLKACSLLKKMGGNVALEISGPITILNSLIDMALLIKAWRKREELIENVFSRIMKELLIYTERAYASGVEILCYADPTGSLSILGPKYSEFLAERFIVPFLENAISLIPDGSVLHLCPKTSAILLKLGLAEWNHVPLEKSMTYHTAFFMLRDRVKIIGQNCIKNPNVTVDEIKELILGKF